MAIAVAIVLALVVVILAARYPVVSLAFFLTTSFFKPLLMMHIGFFQVVDYTLLCGLLVILAMISASMRMPGRLRELLTSPVGLFVLLAVILLFGVLYTPAPSYGLMKSTRFATLNLIAFTAPVFFAARLRNLRAIIILLAIIGAFISAGTLVAPHAAVLRPTAETRASFFETSPLESATMMATGVLICLCYCAMVRTSVIVKLLSCLAIPIMMVAILITGSRGPFVGVLICAIVILFMFRRQLSVWMVPLILVSGIAGTVWLVVMLPRESIERTTKMFAGTYELKEIAYDRTYRFAFVLSHFPRHPFIGRGTGAYAMDHYGIDEPKYPHNIILELLYENGVVGTVVFLALVWAILRRWLVSRQIMRSFGRPPDIEGFVNIVAILVLFTGLQSMKSSDIEGNRFMFFCFGLVLALCKCLKDEYEAAQIEIADAEISQEISVAPVYDA
jgi:O-antigen ligase